VPNSASYAHTGSSDPRTSAGGGNPSCALAPWLRGYFYTRGHIIKSLKANYMETYVIYLFCYVTLVSLAFFLVAGGYIGIALVQSGIALYGCWVRKKAMMLKKTR
jgi:hypothetical protein